MSANKVPSTEEVDKKLQETGKKDELIKYVKDKLKSTDFKEKIRQKCEEIINEKALQKVTVNEILNEITPFAVSNVPQDIILQMLLELKNFIEKDMKA